MKRILSGLCVLIALQSSACYTPNPPEWVPQEIPMCSTMRLWEISRLAMEKNGFPIVQTGFDPIENVVVSGWDRDLHPFKGNGFRERVHIRFKRSENAGMLTIGVRVEQQINDNLAKPMDPEYADWVDAPDNPTRAKVVLQYIQSMLGDSFQIKGAKGSEVLEGKDGA